MKKIHVIVFLVLFPMIFMGWYKSTHRLVSNYASLYSKLISANFVGKMDLGRGLNTLLKVDNETKSAAEWIYYGSIREDEGNFLFNKDRSGRHFHNPLQPFNQAGLIRWMPLKQQLLSSILWAQDGNEQETFDEGDMSWHKVREYYYNALTSNTEEKRQFNFGLMFKGVGHQIHLIQDMACPEHTRNDNHPLWNIEKWVARNLNIISGFCQIPLFPIVDLQTPVNDLSTGKILVPIARLSDADVYKENIVPSADLQQGLAEYSNSNFFSEDTIFSSDFPYPNRESTNDQCFVDLNLDYQTDEYAVYISKIKDGEWVNHLVRLGFFYNKIEGKQVTSIYNYSLDSFCYKDYASMLIPRAVGYSTAWIDYFFRGEIEIKIPEQDGVYGLAAYPDKGFEKIVVMARNATPGEEIKDGKISLVIRYREINSGENEFGGAIPPKPGTDDQYVKYIVMDHPDATGLSGNDFTRLEFNLKNKGATLPVNAADVSLMLVFKGNIGTETADAVAVGTKDISEPTPIEIFNDTDQVCKNGIVYDYASGEVLQYADIDRDGQITGSIDMDIIPRKIKLYKVSFNGLPVSDQNFYFDYADPANQTVEIEPGKFHRMYVLTDDNGNVLFNFNMKYKRPETTKIPYYPPWSVPYYHLQYFWEIEDGGPGNPIWLPPKFFNIAPRVNRLVYNNATNQYEHHYPGSENTYWMLRDKYFFNMIYLTQPNHPKGCACDNCKTYYPEKGLEWKANYVINNIPVWF